MDDPREQHQIGHRWSGLVADMSEKVDAWVNRVQSKIVSLIREGQVMPQHDIKLLRERLQALGYFD